MATDLTLHVIRAADVDPAEMPPLDSMEHTPLPEWFARATQGQLRLAVREHTSRFSSSPADGGQLQQMFREFVASPPTPRLVDDIALLFCRRWIGGNLAGLMFDYDGHDLPPWANVHFDGVPRQACAVFLDALGGEASPADRIYVAVHELGHVFNLAHDDRNESFMGLTIAVRDFAPNDKAHLTAAAEGKWPEQWDYMPGARNFLATSAAWKTTGYAKRDRRGRRSPLVARLAQDTYLPGEPVVLDLEVRTRAGSLPPGAVLDPGYETVQIWYRTPLGEHQLYRPLLRYCSLAHGGRAGRPTVQVKNNPRIHLGGGGLSFLIAGDYTVWAEVAGRGTDGRWSRAVSPPVGFRLRRPANDAERDVSRTLCDPRIAFFVATKSGRLGREQEHALRRLVRWHRQTTPAAHVRYALAHRALRSGDLTAASDCVDGLSLRETSLKEGLSALRAKLAAAKRRGPASRR